MNNYVVLITMDFTNTSEFIIIIKIRNTEERLLFFTSYNISRQIKF